MTQYTIDSYNEIPYESAPIPEAHPDRLYSIARIFGIAASPPKTAKVLEVGCSSGGNLIPLASQFPEARFLGIDIADKPIQEANARAQQFGLSNVEFRQLDIHESHQIQEKFDYLIAHGVYSWLPKKTQKSLLALLKSHLTENGIGFISYNTFPGWHEKLRIRKILLNATNREAAPRAQIRQAREVLQRFEDFSREQEASSDPKTGAVLCSLHDAPDWYLHHEYLSESNDPKYFSDFLREVSESELYYLTDADLSTTSDLFLEQRGYSPSLTQNLRYTERYEEAYDLYTGRQLRRSLLVKKKGALQKRSAAKCMTESFLSTPLQKERIENGSTKFTMGTRGSVLVENTATARIIEHLGNQWPNNVSFTELPHDEPEETLAQELLELFLQGALFIDSRSITHRASAPVEYPRTSPLTKQEAAFGNLLSGARGEKLALNAIERVLTALFSGEHTEEELFQQIQQVQVTFSDGNSSEEVKEIHFRDLKQNTFHSVFLDFQTRLHNAGLLYDGKGTE
ncbi:class I SAM-dependent methyltransferase [bacterium]|nr:class I SAM-dependent methyltransferase [bacterium]